ncbi:MAG: DUF4176 domain-containing protein [Clostridiales bacterium]|nr:DUF4176 domain-containing protein [Clostridiales bacterium]
MENKEIFEKAFGREERFQQDAVLLTEIAGKLSGSERGILSLYDFYQDDKNSIWSEIGCSPLSAEKYGEDVFFDFGDKGLQLGKEDFFLFLSLVSDIFLPILPLGSVVGLKKDALKKMGLPDDYSPDLVIVDRYLAVPDAGIYFPYSGVVYPLGSFGTERKIYFGPQLIEKVIFPGYADRREKPFHALMKEEYILERRLHSMSFAGEQEGAILQSKLREAAGGV